MPDLKTTYDIMKRGGANIGSFSDFKNKLSSDPVARQRVYKAMQDAGDINESYNDFETSIITSDKNTGDPLPTAQEVEQKKKEEQLKQQSKPVPKDDYLKNKFKEESKFPVPGISKETKEKLSPPSTVKVPEDDYLKEQLLSKNPQNKQEAYIRNTEGTDAMLRYRNIKQNHADKGAKYSIDHYLKKTQNDEEMEKIMPFIDERLKNNLPGFVNNTSDAAFYIAGKDPNAYPSIEARPKSYKKLMEEQAEEEAKKPLYAKNAKDAFEKMRMLKDAGGSSKEYLKYREDVISEEAEKRPNKYRAELREVDPKFFYKKEFDKFLENNAKARGLRDASESIPDLFVTPLSNSEKETLRNYMRYVSKANPMEYVYLKNRFANNLFDTKDFEAELVQKSMQFNNSVLKVEMDIAKKQGITKTWEERKTNEYAYDELSKLHKEWSDKVDRLSDNENSPSYAAAQENLSKIANEMLRISGQLEKSSQNKYSNSAYELQEQLNGKAKTLYELNKRAFHTKYGYLFKEQIEDAKKKEKEVNELNELKNSNRTIDKLKWQFSVADRNVTNAFMEFIPNAVEFGAAMGAYLKMAIGGEGTDRLAAYDMRRWHEEISQFKDKMIFAIPDNAHFTDKDGNLVWENTLPAMSRTVADMALLIMGGRTYGNTLGKLGLGNTAAQSVGLVVAGAQLEFPGQYEEAIKSGLKPEDAFKKAFNTTMVIASLELVNPNTKLLTTFKYAGKNIKDLIRSSHWTSSTGKYLKEMGHEVGDEILQEYTQTFGELGMNMMYNDIYGKEYFRTTTSPGELAETAVLTAISTALLHTGTLTTQGIGPKNYNRVMYESNLIQSAETAEMFNKVSTEMQIALSKDKITKERHDNVMRDLTNQRKAEVLSEQYKRPDFVPDFKLKSLLRSQIELEDQMKMNKDNPYLKDQVKMVREAIENHVKVPTGQFTIDNKEVKLNEFIKNVNDNDFIKKMNSGEVNVSVSGDEFMAKYLKYRSDNIKNAEKAGIIDALNSKKKSGDDNIQNIKNEKESQQESAEKGSVEAKAEILDSEKRIADNIDEFVENKISELKEEKEELENIIAQIEDPAEKIEYQERLNLVNKKISEIAAIEDMPDVTEKIESADKKIDVKEDELQAIKEGQKEKTEEPQKTLTEEQIKTEKKSAVKKMLKGKLVYSSPATGKTSAIDAERDPDWIDADNLLKKKMEQLEVKEGPGGVGTMIKDLTRKYSKQRIEYNNKKMTYKEYLYESTYDDIRKLLKEGKTVFTGNKPYLQRADVVIVKEKLDEGYVKDAGSRKVGAINKEALADRLAYDRARSAGMSQRMELGEGKYVSDVLEGNIELPKEVQKSIEQKSDEIENLQTAKELLQESGDNAGVIELKNEQVSLEDKIREEKNKEKAKQVRKLGESDTDVYPSIEKIVDRKKKC